MNEQDLQYSGSPWEPASGSVPTAVVHAAGPDGSRTAELSADRAAHVDTTTPAGTGDTSTTDDGDTT